MKAGEQGARPTRGRQAVWRSQVVADLCTLAELQEHALQREAVLSLWAGQAEELAWHQPLGR